MGGVVLLLALAVLAVPLVGLALLVKVLQLHREMREARERLASLDTRVDALAKRVTAAVAAPSPPPAVGVPQPPPQPAVAPPPPAPAVVTPKPAPPPVPPPKQPPVPPPVPPRPAIPRPQAPPAPEAPAFDWESLFGVRGAAWVGGIALVVAAILFAKFAIDRNLITPELRIALLVLTGLGCLVGAELSLRRGYATTANAVSGAGVAILYAAFFSAHALYGLLPVFPTFVLMALVTVVACVLAIRYDAMFTAVLGLLGGFATPVALSTGEDRPIGLFSYILLLNVGLGSVALRKRWHGLVLLALAGTFLIEYGWFSRHLTPEKVLVGLAAFLLFGLLFLLLPLLQKGDEPEESRDLMRAGAVGGVAPFLFAILIAGNPRYAGEWPLLFAFVGLLLAALAAVALFRARTPLLVSGALAAAVTLPLWASSGLTAANALPATLGVLALTAIASLPLRVGAGLGLDSASEQRAGFEVAGWIAGAGLGLYGFVLAVKNLPGEPWPFVLVVAGLFAVLIERSREGGIRALLPVGAALVALLIQVWFFNTTREATLLRNLSLPLLFAVGLSLGAARRGSERGPGALDAVAVVVATLFALVGLFGCLGSSALGGDPLPLFAALVVGVGLLLLTSLRTAWGGLTFGALVVAALYGLAWQQSYLQPSDLPLVLPIVTVLYIAFLALPFWLPDAVSGDWKRGAWPWLSSALAGPLFFLPLHQIVVKGWGKSAIGLLPVAMAALTVAALYGIARRFAGGAATSQERLRYLALFAAVALGLIAVAIPLQLDRQWITVGWALEGMAVWWLFGRLPHPGLRLFGALLLGAVGARLLLNFEVLRYHERGLPILNWILYTYGVSALACLFGARLLSRAEGGEQARVAGIEATRLPAAASLLGLVLIFALINLEIADYFSPGRYIELSGERGYARNLTTSLAWGLYAMSLLVVGVWRGVRELRYLSLAFLLLTVAKVFLYDLANVGGIYRIFSFLGLGVSLILVSLFYQRFVFRKEPAS